MVVAMALFLLTSVRSESGLRLLIFEARAGKRLAAEAFQLGLNLMI